MRSKLWFSTQYRVFRLSNEPKKEEGKTQTTKAPPAEVSAINPTSGFRLTSTRPRAPPIIISLSDLTISCSSVTNSNHREIRAPPWQAATGRWVNESEGDWVRPWVRGGWDWEWATVSWERNQRMREWDNFGVWVMIYIYIYIYGEREIEREVFL